MSHYIDPRQRAFEAQQSELLGLIVDCGHLVPAVLAKREQIAAHIAESEVRRQLGPQPAGVVRTWLASRLVALGTRLAGAQTRLESGNAREETNR